METDFMEMVEKMRNAQKAYFKNRNHDNLVIAMKLEREVDEEILAFKSDQEEMF